MRCGLVESGLPTVEPLSVLGTIHTVSIQPKSPLMPTNSLQLVFVFPFPNAFAFYLLSFSPLSSLKQLHLDLIFFLFQFSRADWPSQVNVNVESCVPGQVELL